MKISYAITVSNEFSEFQKLIGLLLEHKRSEDQIVVLQDERNWDNSKQMIKDICMDCVDVKTFDYIAAEFKEDFAQWKNGLNYYCNGNYIFQLDADELPVDILIDKLPELLEINEGVDLYWVPRVNTVEGLTQEDINRWHWRVDSEGRINWPDYQGRIYRNSPNIKWTGKVHEKIEGYTKYAFLPGALCLYHPKKIDKQRQQNALYDQIAHGTK